MKIVHAVSLPRNMLPELLLSLIWLKHLDKVFTLEEFETSVIENVAAVRGKAKGEICDRAKFMTVQKLDKQLSFKLVRAMETTSDAV